VKIRLGAILAAAVAATLVGAAPAIAAPPSCGSATVIVDGVGTPDNVVRLGASSTPWDRKVTVDYPRGCAEYRVNFSNGLPSLDSEDRDSRVPHPDTGRITDTFDAVGFSSLYLTNSDAGDTQINYLNFYAPEGGAQLITSNTVKYVRYTSWNTTNAFPEPIDAGDPVTVNGTLRIANWTTGTTTPLPGRWTRLQVRDVTAGDPYPASLSVGKLVLTSAAGIASTTQQLGEASDTTDNTYGLRYVYGGSASFSSSVAAGDPNGVLVNGNP
jgi:hypothetical protein